MFSELISGFPSEISKSYQEAWLKAVNAAAQATQEASQTAAENVKSFSEAARKSSNAFEHRESA
jgi:truncated hemoglobin YjbI